MSPKKTADVKADATAPVKKAAAKKTATKKATTKKTAATKTASANKATKTAEKKVAAAKEAEVIAESYRTPAEIKAALNTLNEEAIAGEKYIEAVDKVKPYVPEEIKEEPKAPAKKAAAKKPAAKKAPVKKETPAQVEAAKEAEVIAESNQTPAEIKAAEETLKAEAIDGAKITEAIDQLAEEKAAPKAPAKKAAAKKPAAKKAAVKKETPAQVEAAKEAEVIAESNQTPAEIKAAEATLKEEAIAGAKIIEAVDAVKGTPYTPEQLSRQTLAAKAFAEGCAQKNLAARSKAAAEKAAKLYKKPAKAAKAVSAKAAGNQIANDIMKEAMAENRLLKLIKEVPGTPYEVVIADIEKKAAMESRKALAAKATTAPETKAPETPVEEKYAFYDTLDDYTLLEMAKTLGVDIDMDTLKNELTSALDLDEQINTYMDKAIAANKNYTFEVDGFDTSVIPYLCRRIAATLPNKAADNVDLAKKINADVDRILINEGMNDSAVYKDLLDDVRKILVYAQHNNLHTLEEVAKVIPADLDKLIDRFMTVAYTILPGWQYNDVKYYEGFIYGVMAQFDDLVKWQNRALMDIADLYIKHGDYQNGNSGYGYVLRENQLKDQIYYRFAHVYEPFDLQRAKNIAQDALRVIDGRYDYYPKILEILQK